jgi:hypothetical protein
MVMMPDSTPEGSDGEYSLDESDQLEPEDTLDEQDLDDMLDEGYDPPERPEELGRYGLTSEEMEEGETLDQRLAEEVPDTPLGGDDPSYVEEYEVGDRRSGRLVADDEGVGEDVESDLVATDVGVNDAGASAEEAAVHTIDDEYETELGTPEPKPVPRNKKSSAKGKGGRGRAPRK